MTGMGAPKWPPTPPRSSRPGKADALLEILLEASKALTRRSGARLPSALVIAAIVLVAVSDRISARGLADGFPQPEVRRSV